MKKFLILTGMASIALCLNAADDHDTTNIKIAQIDERLEFDFARARGREQDLDEMTNKGRSLLGDPHKLYKGEISVAEREEQEYITRYENLKNRLLLTVGCAAFVATLVAGSHSTDISAHVMNLMSHFKKGN